MVRCGYWNKIEPLSGSFERFAIFLLCVVVFSHLVPIQAYVRVFWGPTTLQNPPVELIPWFYNLVWVQDQNRSFVLDFWGICDFSPVGSHFSLFLVTLRSVWATFSRWCYSWGHPGTPIWTSRCMNDLSAANSLQPAQSESFGEIWDRLCEQWPYYTYITIFWRMPSTHLHQ